MPTENKGRSSVKTTETVFEIIEALRAMEGARVTELADTLDKAKSTIHRHLSTLEAQEYVVREGDEYDIGLRFLSLGEYARNRKEAYPKLHPKVKELAEKTDESAQFFVAEHGKAVYVHRETGDNAVSTPNSKAGEGVPLYATAAGKAILSCYPKEKVERILDEISLVALTENTITQKSALHDEIDAIQKRGYSVNREENVNGIHAVGVPVRRTNGWPIGALSISGPAYRLQGELLEETLPALLLETANELELNIAYSD
ncbi:transcriptional regulator [Halogeometricum borinquense DSM 11551]|uniref:Transcriptional regulator n=1 Tax=Halogeometricum borinquense (strain ATCC 700274 / DSM 11551 / JCM 10706 / KCTC 4070 / PR3) TaxID=469382 RepID=E4NU35_HALBP|nr:IclR family transcriptional regulator [Halogeometricum borinquense]ADQ68555.1 transcriptional regulator [Halogeometricum borinquense DSM 11551]ELY25574.1 transcriptional regulator [Halogeometricum borinquense DSM 11551]